VKKLIDYKLTGAEEFFLANMTGNENVVDLAYTAFGGGSKANRTKKDVREIVRLYRELHEPEAVAAETPTPETEPAPKPMTLFQRNIGRNARYGASVMTQGAGEVADEMRGRNNATPTASKLCTKIDPSKQPRYDPLAAQK
jgi:hypothetical protein